MGFKLIFHTAKGIWEMKKEFHLSISGESDLSTIEGVQQALDNAIDFSELERRGIKVKSVSMNVSDQYISPVSPSR